MSNSQSNREVNLPGSKWQRVFFRLDGGPAARAAIGLIALANDLVIEREINYFIDINGVAVYTNRIPFDPNATLETLLKMKGYITETVKGLTPLGDLDVIAYGCTSGSVAIGPTIIETDIKRVIPSAKCTTPISAAAAALKALRCRRIAVLTPYIDEINEHISKYLIKEGFELVSSQSFKVLSATEVAMIHPDSIFEAGVMIGSGDVDALFISCTALRVSQILDRLEQKIGKPVITSNQATAWHSLRLAGINDKLKRIGQYLSEINLN